MPTEERDGDIVITDDTRMRESLPTINYLREQGAKTILMSHFGRPKGKPMRKYSLRPVGVALHDLINHPVTFSHDCIGADAEKIVADMKEGDVTLLENVRFHAGEEANDPMFAESLAKVGDGLYVNDAFGAAHRAHARTAGITRFVEQSAMGFLMEKELKYLGDELAKPAKPFVVILGGVEGFGQNRRDQSADGKSRHDSDRRSDGEHLLESARYSTSANSRVEQDKLDLARELLELAKAKGVNFLLPVDALSAGDIAGRATEIPGASRQTGIPDGWQAVDIGPETIALFKSEIAKAKTILWNGPDGIFEIPEFADGTMRIAEALARSMPPRSSAAAIPSPRSSKRPGGQDDIHLHWRRRVAGIAGRQDVARCRGFNGQVMSPQRSAAEGSRGIDQHVTLQTPRLRFDSRLPCAKKSSPRIGR